MKKSYRKKKHIKSLSEIEKDTSMITFQMQCGLYNASLQPTE